MVMILPAIEAIRQRYPEALLYAVTSQDGLRLLKLAGFEEQNICVYRHSLIYRFIDRMKVKAFLKQRHFESAFCFEANKKRRSLLPAQSTVLSHSTTLEHYSTRCLQLVNPQSSAVYHTTNFTLHPDKRFALERQLAAHQITEKTILIGLHPTYSGFHRLGRRHEKIHRLWPWRNFSALAVRLAQYAEANGIDLKIVMDLLPNERKIGLKIQKESQNSAILLSSEPDFQRYLHLIRRLNVLIASNTGVIHLASALHTPLVALFSDFHPGDCGPYMPAEQCVVLRAEETNEPEQGLAAISVEQVARHVIQLLQAAA